MVPVSAVWLTWEAEDVLALGLTAHDGAFFGIVCLETDPSTLFFIVNPCLVVFLADILLSHFFINLFRPEKPCVTLH